MSKQVQILRISAALALGAATAAPASAQRFYRAPTLAESIKIEFDSLLVGIQLSDSSARLAKLAISEYESARRTLRPLPTRMQEVADSLRARRDSTIRAVLPTRADSSRFDVNALLRRRPRA